MTADSPSDNPQTKPSPPLVPAIRIFHRGRAMNLDHAGRIAKLPPTPPTMDPLLLRILHLAGVIVLFTSIGAVMLAGSGKKSASILHGIALVVILLTGFAWLKKPPMDEPWWMIKLGIWIFLGVAPVLAKRKLLPAWLVLALCLAGGFAAAWFGVYKTV